MLDRIKETVQYVKANVPFEPTYGIILGTGLGRLVDEIDVEHSLDYSTIPNFPVSTVESHEGKLLFGMIGEKKVVAMQGRFHYYEGYDMKEITFPVRVLKELGIKMLFISNACGGLNRDYKKGDLMILNDHINLFPGNPLIGENYEELGPRFPDMSNPYDRELVEKAKSIAQNNEVNVHVGVYVGLPGPNLETRAEYAFLRTIGADVVGMSTVPEVIVANHTKIPVFAISVITDECFPETLQPVTIEEVIEVANKAEPKMTLVMKELITSL